MSEPVNQIHPIWDRFGLKSPLILASSSPRRAALLKAIGCPFEVIPPDEVESDYIIWDDGELLRRWAVQKAESVHLNVPNRYVLAADTVIRLDDRIFGKPSNQKEAAEMLALLSGRVHQVWTAMHLFRSGEKRGRTTISCTRVTFRHLNHQEIEAYIQTGEPMDKAGAYGIQNLGGLWVEKIEGCYFNVVGLPLSKLWDLLTSPEDINND
jgi:septum formation protein